MSGLQSKENPIFALNNSQREELADTSILSKDIRSRPQTPSLKAFPLSQQSKAVKSFEEDSEVQHSNSVDFSSDIEPHVAMDNWIPVVDEYIRINDISAAHSVLQKIFAKDPYNIVAMELLATCLKKEKQIENALRIRLEMERLGDKDFHNLTSIGHLYIELGQEDKSESYFSMAIRRQPTSQLALFELEKSWGNVCLRSGDIESCEEHYNRAFSINPHSDVLLVNYGTLEIQKGEYAKALKRFRMAVDLNAHNDKAWMGLSLVHRQYGDLDLSWGNLEKSLDINPGNETAIQLMMEWGLKDGLLDRVISRVDRYLHLYPDNLDLVLALAKLLYCTNRLMPAKLEVERVLSFEPNHSAALNLEAMIEKSLQLEDGAENV